MNSAFETTEWHLATQAPWGRLGLALGVAAAIAIVLLGALSAWREPKRGRRTLLVVLRAGAAAAALMLLVQPAVQLEDVTRLPNRVAVLVDASESMTLAEGSGAPTRAKRAADLLRASSPRFAEWRKEHRLDFYTFGAALEPSAEEALLAGAESAGDATHLREALAALRSRYPRRELGGVIVISDGIDNGRFAELSSEGGELDPEARDFLSSLETPVHTVWTGRPGLRDVAIARVLADDFAFARNTVKVEAVVRVIGAKAAGWSGRTLPVTLRLLSGGTDPRGAASRVIKSTEVTVDPAKPDQKVSFEFTPDRVGKYLYEVSTPLLDGEAIPSNNSRTFLLKVIRDKVRVLQVAGRPSWDERFLRGLLKHDPNIDLISFFILRTASSIEAVSPDEMSLIPFPTEELFLEQLRSFDVVFLQDFNYAPYGIGAYLNEIKRYVEEGGGLAMLGGDLSFSSGGYAHTPVAEVLPVELLEEGPPEKLFSLDPFKMLLTREGRAHPITALKLDPRENAARWDALPPLDGTNLIARARPGATVLATHPFLRGVDGKPLPVLAVSDVAKGRSLALTSDSSWRWGFSAALPPPGARNGRGDRSDGSAGPTSDDERGRYYQRFWENAIRWLIKDPELRFLRLETDQSEYGRGDAVRLAVRALQPDYHPARGIDVTLQVWRVGAGGAQVAARTLRTDENGEAQLELPPLLPGGYRATARATRVAAAGETALGAAMQDDEVFLVRGGGRELEDAEARDGVLRAVARATDGSFRGPGDDLGNLRFLEPEVVRVNKHRDVELWSTWITLLAAALFLSSEWALRRRWGLA